jgi:hypothetical protein
MLLTHFKTWQDYFTQSTIMFNTQSTLISSAANLEVVYTDISGFFPFRILGRWATFIPSMVMISYTILKKFRKVFSFVRIRWQHWQLGCLVILDYSICFFGISWTIVLSVVAIYSSVWKFLSKTLLNKVDNIDNLFFRFILRKRETFIPSWVMIR